MNKIFQEEYVISIRDINYGNHMDHLALLNYLHESRVRFLRKIGYSELNVDGKGSGLVVVELNCKYRKECFYGDKITISLTLEKISDTRLKFNYTISKENNLVVAAEAQITIAIISQEKKVLPIPQNLLEYTDLNSTI